MSVLNHFLQIYHSFHDEVDVYRQHWWRCNGPCQNRRPFFGYVKRAMNRPPSARDPWWAEHQRTCGGTYTKIKEPENYGKSGKGDKKKDKNASSEKSKTSKPPSSSTGDELDISTLLNYNIIVTVNDLYSISSNLFNILQQFHAFGWSMSNSVC